MDQLLHQLEMQHLRKEQLVMNVQKRRLEKGWSQEHLAHISGLSVRTIQRIESGKKAGLESLKCLAAVFEIDVNELKLEDPVTQTTKTTAFATNAGNPRENEAVDYVQNLKAFHLNWICYVLIMPCLFFFNIYVTPEYFWVIWPALGWGLGIALHALTLYGLFGLFGHQWEKKQIDKRLDQKN